MSGWVDKRIDLSKYSDLITSKIELRIVTTFFLVRYSRQLIGSEIEMITRKIQRLGQFSCSK